MEMTQASIDRWMDQENVIYVYEFYSAIKKKWNISICDSVYGPEGIMLSEMSEKDKYHMNSFLYGIKNKKLSSQIQRTDWWLPEARMEGGQSEWGSQKAQTLSYKTDKP